MKKRISKVTVTILMISSASVFLFLYDFFMYDILRIFDNPGARLALGMLCYVIVFLYAVLALVVIIYALIKIKEFRYFIFIHAGIITLTVLFFTYIPYTEAYKSIYFAVERDHLEKTIQLINTGDVCQTGNNEFIVPYRLTSHDGKMYVENKNGILRAEFCIYWGYNKAVVLLYSSCDCGIYEENYVYGYYKKDFFDVRKLDTNWYTAIFTY